MRTRGAYWLNVLVGDRALLRRRLVWPVATPSPRQRINKRQKNPKPSNFPHSLRTLLDYGLSSLYYRYLSVLTVIIPSFGKHSATSTSRAKETKIRGANPVF